MSAREEAVAEAAPIIEDLESRYPEKFIAEAVVDAVEPILTKDTAERIIADIRSDLVRQDVADVNPKPGHADRAIQELASWLERKWLGGS